MPINLPIKLIIMEYLIHDEFQNNKLVLVNRIHCRFALNLQVIYGPKLLKKYKLNIKFILHFWWHLGPIP